MAAVLATGVLNPTEVDARCAALAAAQQQNPELYEDLEIAYKRANNLRDAELGTQTDAALMGDEEKVLQTAIAAAQAEVDTALAAGNYAVALASLAGLRAPIDAFFDAVMVKDKDEALRNNRMKLLNSFVAVFSNVADFEKLAG